MTQLTPLCCRDVRSILTAHGTAEQPTKRNIRINEAYDEARARARQRGLRITTALAAHTPATVAGYYAFYITV